MFGKLFISAALVALVNAVQITNSDFSSITVGTPFTITWNEATGPVNILLKTGPALVQTVVGTIASGVSSGSFVWTPTAAGVFNFEIQDGSVVNYSIQFPVLAEAGASVTTAVTTVASTESVSSVVATVTATSPSAFASDISITGTGSVVTSIAAVTGSVTTAAAGTVTGLPVINNSTLATSATGSTKAATSSHSSATTSSTNVPLSSTNGAVVKHASSFALAVVAVAAFLTMN